MASLMLLDLRALASLSFGVRAKVSACCPILADTQPAPKTQTRILILEPEPDHIMDSSQTIKCLATGDDWVGKTTLLTTYTTNEYPTKVLPLMKTCIKTVVIDDKPISVNFWDSLGGDGYDRMRPYAFYPKTNVFLVCYSVALPSTFEHVRTKWMPELIKHFPQTPFILVATMIEKREDADTVDHLASKGLAPITTEQGQKLAKEINAASYMECSSATQKGVKEVFEEAIRVVLDTPENQKKCLIM